MDTDEAEHVIGDLPPWGAARLRELRTTLLSAEEPFPCTFAVSGMKRGMLRYGFVGPVGEPGAVDALASVLTAYLESYRSIGRETSLVVFFRPDRRVRPLAEQRADFWGVLEGLRARDPEPWPRDVPGDPDDPLWEFCFRGAPLFVVCNTPAHGRRRSRHSPGFFITFQPRWVFEGLEEGTPRGDSARRVIRDRLRRFDGMEPSTVLGSYGAPDNREWRQYFLPDTDAAPEGWPERCPMRAAEHADPPGEGGSPARVAS
ncbi:YqcI/YcgG family protein [Nocardiopsis baichengensis]|uniref:YqcI/YcgG family protein n=1 Tax=Nocardiopsis baichengensis TaxID=280240 RepID=UPI00034BC0C2|nr:YqcI/YcgG family protein [Nocardiopsis baichengensis]